MQRIGRQRNLIKIKSTKRKSFFLRNKRIFTVFSTRFRYTNRSVFRLVTKKCHTSLISNRDLMTYSLRIWTFSFGFVPHFKNISFSISVHKCKPNAHYLIFCFLKRTRKSAHNFLNVFLTKGISLRIQNEGPIDLNRNTFVSKIRFKKFVNGRYNAIVLKDMNVS